MLYVLHRHRPTGTYSLTEYCTHEDGTAVPVRGCTINNTLVDMLKAYPEELAEIGKLRLDAFDQINGYSSTQEVARRMIERQYGDLMQEVLYQYA